MSDLTEAAKRFRDSACSECDADMEQYAQDRQQLAAAMAVELDDETVTIERLKKLLGDPGYIHNSGCNWIIDDPYCEVCFYTITSVIMFYSENIQLDAEPETMGQLRALLRLAGIEVPR